MGAVIYLMEPLPVLGAAALRGPQITAPPLGSYCCRPARAPRGRAVRMPRRRPRSPSGEGGVPGDGSIEIPLTVGLLMVPTEGTRPPPTVLPAIQVRKAALLFAQISSHAATTRSPRDHHTALISASVLWSSGPVDPFLQVRLIKSNNRR